MAAGRHKTGNETRDNWQAIIQAHADGPRFEDFRGVSAELPAERKVEVLHMVPDGKTKR